MRKEKFTPMEMHPHVLLALQAASVSGMIGDRAYKKLYDLATEEMRFVSKFLEGLADAKEKSDENN